MPGAVIRPRVVYLPACSSISSQLDNMSEIGQLKRQTTSGNVEGSLFNLPVFFNLSLLVCFYFLQKTRKRQNVSPCPLAAISDRRDTFLLLEHANLTLTFVAFRRICHNVDGQQSRTPV